MEPLLTTEDVAEYLRLEVVTVRRLIARGELPAYRIGGEYRFIGPDLESHVKSQLVSKAGDNFDKFTERTRKVLSFANEEAAQLGHHYIGTEHLLLGILREGEGVAALALMYSGLDFKEVREHVLAIIARSSQQRSPAIPGAQLASTVKDALFGDRVQELLPSGERVLTKRAKKVLELSIDEARRVKDHFIGTEHLLVGILREGEGLAAQVLIGEFALRLDLMRERIMHILQEQAGRAGAIPAIPEQAGNLLAEADRALVCHRCSARSPEYFHYCFNCGMQLFSGHITPQK